MSDLRPRSPNWKWFVCGLLLLALVLNYMDRQTLSQTITDISRDLHLNNEQYGELEMGFGLAFALGAIAMGILADSLSIRWLYPAVLIGWSMAGIATAYGAEIGRFLAANILPSSFIDSQLSEAERLSREAYLGLMICRVTLGFFEAGQWPCALVTTQRLLSREDRSFGNSLLQSGASVGAIFTPIVVQTMVTDEPGTWRKPFVVIGAVGMTWIVPWLLMIGKHDLDRKEESPATTNSNGNSAAATGSDFLSRYLLLIVVVIAINATWQYFRVWLPKWLREFHQYERATVNYFTAAYYVATDIGCIATGAAVKWLASRNWDVHRARLVTFFGCALLTSLSVVAANLSKGPLLLGLLLLIAFGSLGLFPNYYAFTQELSSKHQGKVTGSLGAITWVVSSVMQKYVGRAVDATGSYSTAIMLVGLAPLVACIPLWLFWKERIPSAPEARREPDAQ